MTYFGFLARFVVLPMLFLRFFIWQNRRTGQQPPAQMRSWPETTVLAGHAITALTYTTIWDNYLVYSGIWSYDSDLVTGHTIGYVPIEEYSFFVLQPLLTGSWAQFLSGHIKPDDAPYNRNPLNRLIFTAGLGAVWTGAIISLLKANPQNKYLGLILGWALPPIMFQTAFGGDILWRHRKLLAASILPATLYLGYADSVAIGEGTWRINPRNTVGIDVIDNLPLEEFLFFFLTNVLLVCGITLVQSEESENRLPEWLKPGYQAIKARLLGNNSV